MGRPKSDPGPALLIFDRQAERFHGELNDLEIGASSGIPYSGDGLPGTVTHSLQSLVYSSMMICIIIVQVCYSIGDIRHGVWCFYL